MQHAATRSDALLTRDLRDTELVKIPEQRRTATRCAASGKRYERRLRRDAVRVAHRHQITQFRRDVFHERELLVGSFGRLFERHGSGRNRIPPAPVDRQLLARVKDRMHADYACELRLEDLAAEVGLTTFQLIGLFKRTVGLTPHTYLTQVRLNMACRRLRHAPVLADIATGVGFYDQSALNKHFKRCYGITPTQFARAAAGA